MWLILISYFQITDKKRKSKSQNNFATPKTYLKILLFVHAWTSQADIYLAPGSEGCKVYDLQTGLW